MNSDYKVGDLIYDANIYDAMNTNLDDWYFYKRWLPENKDARMNCIWTFGIMVKMCYWMAVLTVIILLLNWFDILAVQSRTTL